MKTIILSLALSLFVCVVAFAKDLTPTERINSKAKQVTQVMAQKLKLNESEYIRLKMLNQERFAQAAQVAEAYKQDAEAKDAKLKEVEATFEQQLVGMLSATQLNAFLEFKEYPPINYTTLLLEKDLY